MPPSAPILAPDTEGISRAVDALRAGQRIGLPTETVYGLAADGLNPLAAAGIFRDKGRPLVDPLILHVAPGADLHGIAQIPAPAQRLMAAFWPGPLTLILPRGPRVPELVSAGLPSVALRCPQHPVAQAVLRAFGGPLAAPSANRFGRISPTTPQAVHSELGDRIALILDGGPCAVGLESTIVDARSDDPEALRLLRHGAILGTQIRQALGLSGDLPTSRPVQVVAPGQLDAHYAPRTPLWRARGPLEEISAWPEGAAALYLTPPPSPPRAELWSVLAPDGTLHTAAASLFHQMRVLDEAQPRLILCAPIPAEGLGHAINDRLLRASSGEVEWGLEGLQWRPRVVSGPPPQD